jgi:hypothetical protein
MSSQSSYTFIAKALEPWREGRGKVINMILPALFSESQDSSY